MDIALVSFVGPTCDLADNGLKPELLYLTTNNE